MKKEKRKLAFRNVEVRTFDADGKKIVEGLVPYDSRSVPIWGTVEVISRTAFKKTLADASEVRALWNHNDTHVLGNTKSGTLTLENTEGGLVCRCELPRTSYADDLYEIIGRGDVTTMSFGFTPVKWTHDNEGDTRTLKEVQLHEVSFGVCFPAYTETTSQAYMRGLEKRNIDIEKLNGVLEKDELLDADRQIIRRTVEALSGLIGDEAARGEPAEATPGQAGTSETGDSEALRLQIEAELAA